MDGRPSSSDTAWAQIARSELKTVGRIVVRMPIVPTRHQVSERTFGLLRVQAWDGSAWEDVDAVGNPIEDWIVPTVADGPGDEVRTLAFLPVTTRTRVVFEEANV